MTSKTSYNCIVLKSFNLGEADKVVTLLSDSQGKVALLAKGVRRNKSRFGALVDPFTELLVTTHLGKGAFPILTGAEVLGAYLDVRSNWSLLSYGYAMLEAVDRYTQERHPEPRLYKLLKAGLGALSNSDADKELILLTFDVKLAAITGFLPNLFSCTVCGRKSAKANHFSPGSGGAVCAHCLATVGDQVPMSSGLPSLTWRLLYSSFSDLREARTDAEARGLRRLLMAHLDYHAQTRLPARQLLLPAVSRDRQRRDKH